MAIKVPTTIDALRANDTFYVEHEMVKDRPTKYTVKAVLPDKCPHKTHLKVIDRMGHTVNQCWDSKFPAFRTS